MSRNGFFAIAALLLSASRVFAAISGLQPVATGVGGAIFVTHAPGDTTRLFMVERGGTIRILNLATGTQESTPFLTIPGIDQEGEGGLRGLAFHPDFATNGKFYVDVTIDNGGQVYQGKTSPFSVEVREYMVSADPNIANTSFVPVLSIIQPTFAHNAGWLGFSPVNNFLYIATGDGGGGNDDDVNTPGGNAQILSNNLLGKMLRIDVNGDDFPGDAGRNYRIVDSNPFADVRDESRNVTTVVPGDDEIFAYGLRNPFRASFDRVTGDLWIGDVGQNDREEIDLLPASRTEAANFGWKFREGDVATPVGGGAEPPHYVAPVYAYTHPDTSVPPVSPVGYDGRVVTGGYVYRGPDPSLQGKYFFLDSSSSGGIADDNYWIADTSPFGSVTNIDSLMNPDGGAAQFPVSFGEDAAGNLYVTYLVTGQVHRIATNELLKGDFDADGDVDGADYAKWKLQFDAAASNPPADGNGNATADAADYAVWRKNLGASVHAGAGAGLEVVPEPICIVLMTHLGALVSVVALFRRRQLCGYNRCVITSRQLSSFRCRNCNSHISHFALIAFLIASIQILGDAATAADRPPNIVLVLADDLGYGDLGCYGQKLIETPRLDRLAAEGIRFTQFYAGSTVCAPSRCVLMTGLHTGHGRVRGNGAEQISSLTHCDVTIATMLKQAGYATALCGKWGLGADLPGNEGLPNDQGFDYFFGYLSQVHAHNYYPDFLWRNKKQVPLQNVLRKRPRSLRSDSTKKLEYSPDLVRDEAIKFVKQHRDQPFFLYWATTIPHADNEAKAATGDGQEVPDYGIYADRPWPSPDRGQAAMITRLDSDVGRLLDTLRELGIEKNTLVLFTSDNGPHHEGGQNTERFDANGPLRGMKRDLYEGGIRVPLIARWPGTVPAGAVSDHIGYFGDAFATLADLAQQSAPKDLDSISMLPTFRGQQDKQQEHDYLYWEFYEQETKQAMRWQNWKAVRMPMITGSTELYDLAADGGETKNVASVHAEIAHRLEKLMDEAHVPDPHWMPKKN
jgi:arylsulfatase A-like enzyme/glucose/arabinose dehydrogenase